MGKELQVFTAESPALSGLFAVGIVAQVNALLEGTNLTHKRLVLDLAASLTANPKVGEAADPAGAYACIITAARFQTTFGDGGLWPIPDRHPGEKQKDGSWAKGRQTIRAQESEKFIVDRAKTKAGVQRIEARLIFKKNQPVVIDRDPAGQISGFRITEGDIFAEGGEEETDLVGGFGIVHFLDDRPPQIYDFSLADLERRRKHSPAGYGDKMSPSWKNDWVQMYERSIRAAVGRIVAPIRTAIPGSAGSPMLPSDSDAYDITETSSRVPASSEEAASSLLERTEEGEIPFSEGPKHPSEPPPETTPLPRPTIEDLPEDLRNEADTNGALGEVFAVLAEGYVQLPFDKLSLKSILLMARKGWDEELPDNTKEIKGILDWFWFKAEKAGYPQPARK